jgi:hypothetical protein
VGAGLAPAEVQKIGIKVETTLVVVDVTAVGVGSLAEIVVGVTVRLVAFTGLVFTS